jgi:transcriptional regulator with XRE-family HTH domain
MVMRGNPDLAHELAVFLRSRRERLVPAQVGLPERGRPRRTPGLRREEVAELAGVSVDYVVRLEQGRGLHPSPEVLDALARALRLSQDERAYLFAMAAQRPAPRPRLGCAEASPGANVPAHDSVTARLVHDLSPLPAMLVDHRGDLLAWNAEMGALLLMDDDSTAGRPNVIELCLFHPELRQFYLDRETVIREAVADLRAAWAAHPDDVRLASLIDEWCGRSEEFARHWESRDVRVNGHGVKRLAHPRIGEVTVEFEVLTPLPDPAQRLVIYRPADAGSREALGRLGREYANS